MRWSVAMERALYGEGGFFRRADSGPGDHFRTSVHASPLFAGAIATLLCRVDEALGRPDRLDVVDVGAGRGELLTALLAALPPTVARRVAATAVERAPRPPALRAPLGWTNTVPDRVTGLLVATEWLDNVPVDIVEVDEHGTLRYVCVDERGTEWLDEGPIDPADAAWLRRWWPLGGAAPGTRAEIGAPRDAAWAAAAGAVERGLALSVDYGHVAAARPAFGTLTGFRDGRQAHPVPDGSTDLTVAVALDAVAGSRPVPDELLDQRTALHLLGVDGRRPSVDLATTDPAGYVRALGRASAAAELTDPAGLGGHHWVMRWV